MSDMDVAHNKKPSNCKKDKGSYKLSKFMGHVSHASKTRSRSRGVADTIHNGGCHLEKNELVQRKEGDVNTNPKFAPPKHTSPTPIASKGVKDALVENEEFPYMAPHGMQDYKPLATTSLYSYLSARKIKHSITNVCHLRIISHNATSLVQVLNVLYMSTNSK